MGVPMATSIGQPSIGQPSIATLIATLDAADSAPRLLAAVEALAAAQSIEAIPILVKVLGYNNPGAAVAAVDGLIQLGEPAATALIELVDGYNYGARAWALRALAGIGDPRSFDLIVTTALEDFSQSVRRAATRGIGSVQWQQVEPDRRKTMQRTALTSLFQILQQDNEWVVRYAALTALEQLCQQLDPRSVKDSRDRLAKICHDDEALIVRSRAQLAIDRI
jgi:phycocyanobilin lyase subunit beta